MYILIDIGGTKTRIAFTQGKEKFSEPFVFKTPQNFSVWLATLHSEVCPRVSKGKLSGVIVGLPGTVTKEGAVRSTPNLPDWTHVPLKHHLENLFSTNIMIHNDTALVGLGEAVFGAGKGHDIVAYLTISTGVNGVRVVHGAIDVSASGFEIGHTIIDNEHDVESYISGGALERKFGKPSHEVHDISLWEKVTHYAGIFGANTTMYWSPSIIVYGGPVMNDLHIESIEREAKKFLHMYDTTPIFVRGTLKDFGGLYGALAVANTLKEKE